MTGTGLANSKSFVPASRTSIWVARIGGGGFVLQRSSFDGCDCLFQRCTCTVTHIYVESESSEGLDISRIAHGEGYR
jgi:hypothetical protein